MSPEQLQQALCGAFEVAEEFGTLLVRTPFGVDFNDTLVLRVRPDANGFRIDDNGDTALALALSGADVDTDRMLEAIECVGGVQVDADDNAIRIPAEQSFDVADGLFRVAAAALRVHAACRPRQRAIPGDLKERVVALLTLVAQEANVPILTDQLVEETGSLVADAILGEAEPLIVFAAGSVERLMEAELLYLRRQISHRPGYVCAVVQSARAIGQKHFSRANYYTDKAVEFDGWSEAFREFVQARVAGMAH